MKSDNAGHRERLKEKVRDGIEQGKPFQGLHDYEIMEYYLFFLLPRIDTKPIAKSLLAKFGTISSVFDASLTELIKIDGIKEKTALGIISLRELLNIYKNDKIAGSDLNISDLKETLQIIFKNKLEERLYLITINSKNKIISSEFILSGNKNSVFLDISAVVKKAVQDSASAVIIAHNHPGNKSEPSNEDIVITSELQKTLNKINVSLLDHFIISEIDIYSFRESGIL